MPALVGQHLVVALADWSRHDRPACLAASRAIGRGPRAEEEIAAWDYPGSPDGGCKDDLITKDSVPRREPSSCPFGTRLHRDVTLAASCAGPLLGHPSSNNDGCDVRDVTGLHCSVLSTHGCDQRTRAGDERCLRSMDCTSRMTEWLTSLTAL